MRETLLWIQEGWTRASPTLLDAAGRLDAAAHAWVTTRLAGRVPLDRRSVGLALAVVTGLWLWGAAGSGEIRSVAGLQEATDSPAREWEKHDIYLGWSRAEEWQPRLVWNLDPPRRRVLAPGAVRRSSSPEPRGSTRPLLDRPVPRRATAEPPAPFSGKARTPLQWARLPALDPALDGAVAVAWAPATRDDEPADPSRSEPGGAPPDAGGGAAHRPSASAGPAHVSLDSGATQPTAVGVDAEPISSAALPGLMRRALKRPASGSPPGSDGKAQPLGAPADAPSGPAPPKAEPALGPLPSVAQAAPGQEGSSPAGGPAVVTDHRNVEDLAASSGGSPPGLLVAKGGSLGGSGTVGGPLSSQGVVSPGHSPGVIDVLGDFLLDDDGVLEIELAGATPDAFDRLVVQGIADLLGTVKVTPLDGFQPQPGDVFDVVSATEILTGSTHFDLPVLDEVQLTPSILDDDPGQVLQLQTLPIWNMRIGAIPEPSTALLFAFGLLGLALRR